MALINKRILQKLQEKHSQLLAKGIIQNKDQTLEQALDNFDLKKIIKKRR